MIKQCKGKDFDKVPVKRLEEKYYGSLKYDGNYTQIHKFGERVRFFTSGGKEYYVKHIAEMLVKLNQGKNFIIECEYIGETTGLLGSRGECTTTTFRTNFKKGLPSGETGREFFVVFDVMHFEGEKLPMKPRAPFSVRLAFMKQLQLGTQMNVADQELLTLAEFQHAVIELTNIGYEGLMLKSPDHLYLPDKRVNNCIKLKIPQRANLKCMGTTKGKNAGEIGALIIRDSKGIECKVASGLSPEYRRKDPSEYIGKVIPIEYERIEKTYVQPRILMNLLKL